MDFKKGNWNADVAFDIEQAQQLLEDDPKLVHNIMRDLGKQVGPEGLKPRPPLLKQTPTSTEMLSKAIASSKCQFQISDCFLQESIKDQQLLQVCTTKQGFQEVRLICLQWCRLPQIRPLLTNK